MVTFKCHKLHNFSLWHDVDWQGDDHFSWETDEDVQFARWIPGGPRTVPGRWDCGFVNTSKYNYQ